VCGKCARKNEFIQNLKGQISWYREQERTGIERLEMPQDQYLASKLQALKLPIPLPGRVILKSVLNNRYSFSIVLSYMRNFDSM
jgi:hypothetical protein